LKLQAIIELKMDCGLIRWPFLHEHNALTHDVNWRFLDYKHILFKYNINNMNFVGLEACESGKEGCMGSAWNCLCVWHCRFSRRHVWRWFSFGILRRVVWYLYVVARINFSFHSYLQHFIAVLCFTFHKNLLHLKPAFTMPCLVTRLESHFRLYAVRLIVLTRSGTQR
jgi:hypothetical protein